MHKANLMKKWVRQERVQLWLEFIMASERAMRTPDPRDPEHWSIEMLGIAERIKEASNLLGGPTSWREINYDGFPYYFHIEGVLLPSKGWRWLEDYVNRPGKAPSPTALWALNYRPGV